MKNYYLNYWLLNTISQDSSCNIKIITGFFLPRNRINLKIIKDTNDLYFNNNLLKALNHNISIIRFDNTNELYLTTISHTKDNLFCSNIIPHNLKVNFCDRVVSGFNKKAYLLKEEDFFKFKFNNKSLNLYLSNNEGGDAIVINKASLLCHLKNIEWQVEPFIKNNNFNENEHSLNFKKSISKILESGNAIDIESITNFWFW